METGFDTSLAPLLLVVALIWGLHRLLSPRQTPTIVYIPQETYTETRGLGCLPIILLGLLALLWLVSTGS
jgi:hypothetical protein